MWRAEEAGIILSQYLQVFKMIILNVHQWCFITPPFVSNSVLLNDDL